MLRTVARSPIGFFRAGYGWLFGERFLMLQHTGRRSGLPRFVVLEVVRRLPDGRYVIAAGTGKTADWYRNVRAESRVRMWVGRLRDAPAVARPLGDEEARHQLEAYRTEHPTAWRVLRPVIARATGRAGAGDDELFCAVPLVELLRVAPAPSPPR